MTPYVGQIMMASFALAPKHFAHCDGQLLAISNNQALYSLLGTTYGGNGSTNFALPDLRGRTALHLSNTYPLGQRSGAERVTLTMSNIPSHTHPLYANDGAPTQEDLVDGVPATTATGTSIYTNQAAMAILNHAALENTGGNQPHDNMQPSLVINFTIALAGIFPQRA